MPTLLRKKNYLRMIENSMARPTDLFKNVYASIDGFEKDILENGLKSCAFFCSCILYLNKLCSDIHARVDGLESDLIGFGWKEINQKQARD